MRLVDNLSEGKKMVLCRWAEQIEWKDEDYEPINREGRVHGPYATVRNGC